MGLISRFTEFIANTKATASDVNAEFDRLHNLVNGDIDNDNIDTLADIAQTKIADISNDAAAARNDQIAGNSASPSLASDIQGELERLRYRVQENGVGRSAVFFDAAGDPVSCSWQELPIVGPNLLTNPSFEWHTLGADNAPDGWTEVGDAAVLITQTTATTEGKGNEVRFQATNGSAEGLSQAVTEIKDSAYYLIGCRLKSVVNDAHIVISGDVVSTPNPYNKDGDIAESSLSYLTNAVVVKADTTPTSITMSILTDGAIGDEFKADHCFMYELGEDRVGVAETKLIVVGSGNTLHRNPVTATDSLAANTTGTYCAVTVTTLTDRPCYIEVTGCLAICADSSIKGTEVDIKLEHANDGVPTWGTYLTDSILAPSTGQQNVAGTIPIHFIVEAPGINEQNDFRISVENLVGSGGVVYINQVETGVGTLTFESSLTAIVRPKE